MTHASADSKVVIANIPVNRMTAAAWTYRMVQDWQNKKTSDVPVKVATTINGQVVSLFATNPIYHDALLKADYVAADGMSTVFASRMTEAPLAERVSTTDWFHSAAEAACMYGIRFYMLGGTSEIIAMAAARVQRHYPMLHLVGWRDGYFDRREIRVIANEIDESGADILWIGVGNPDQLLLAHRFKKLVPRLTWVRTCGGLLDFLSGTKSRAPLMMQKIGLEWAYRLIQEPKRLGWRYATTNLHSAYLMAAYSRRDPATQNLYAI